MRSYNPGLVQSLFMAPIGAAYLYTATKHHQYGWLALLGCLLFGGPVGHGLFLLVPLRLLTQRAIGHAIFAVWLLTGLVAVPLLISTLLQCVVRGGARGEKKAA